MKTLAFLISVQFFFAKLADVSLVIGCSGYNVRIGFGSDPVSRRIPLNWFLCLSSTGYTSILNKNFSTLLLVSDRLKIFQTLHISALFVHLLNYNFIQIKFILPVPVVGHSRPRNKVLHLITKIDRVTAACRRSDCQLFADRGCHVVSVKDPYGRILCFLDRSRYFSIK
jgi:hypothetical protein